jgi:hypothetical protein
MASCHVLAWRNDGPAPLQDPTRRASRLPVVATRGKETPRHSIQTAVLAEATTATSARPRFCMTMCIDLADERMAGE